MIKSIWIDNFKSLVDFRLEFAKFSCLVGLNGSGKSTVLQAIDFLSQLMRGDLKNWLSFRGWEDFDLSSKIIEKNTIDFEVIVEDEDYGEITWKGCFSQESLSCIEESVITKNFEYVFKNKTIEVKFNPGLFKDGVSIVSENTEFNVMFKYKGSIFSSLIVDDDDLAAIPRLFSTLLNVKSFDLLSPNLMRSQIKKSDGDLGIGGEKLAAFIHELDEKSKNKLQRYLVEKYTQLESIETRSLPSGIKELEIVERFGDQQIKSSARHINDGLLRLMAIFSQIESDNLFLLFDEIENGINPELIEFLIDQLVNAPAQVLVTTHSPMILNYLEDDVAKQGVIYLYKNKQGMTRAVKLFDLPSMAAKLQFMGPGEAFVDTDLTRLYQEVESLNA